jgi:hypothetical protein
METFLDIQNSLKSDLLSSASSTLFTTDRIKELVNNGNQRATSLFSWPALERARVTTLPNVFDGDQYIDYPEDYRTDTMKEYIIVDSKKFSRMGWDEFVTHQLEDSNDDDLYFADYARQVFIYPHQTPGVNVTLWGQIQAPKLVDDDDLTIFSKHDESGNIAIKKLALSEALLNIDPILSDKEEKGAIALLSVIWDKIARRQQYAQPKHKQMFRVYDFFGNSGLSGWRGFN